MRIHLDTDLGGDPDDVCALAFLLGWPDVEIVGITTTLDRGGVRAGYVDHCLELAGRRTDIPVAAGNDVSLTTLRPADPVLDDERFWPAGLARRPSTPGAALDLLHASVEQDATIVAIGPYTNLALLEVSRAGSLGRVPVVVMGGWTEPPAKGLPQWGPEFDFNVQWDVRAAEIVAQAAGTLTLATLGSTLGAHLREADLPRLRASGPLGDLAARQSEAHADVEGMRERGRVHAALPDDLLNFHYDPVACAAAMGWPGAAIEERRLRTVVDEGVLRFDPANGGGRAVQVLVDVDSEAFTQTWLTAVEAAQRQ